MKKMKIFVPEMLGMIFFRAPWLRGSVQCLALRSSLLQYSKGFTLLPFKNGVEIAAVEGGRPVSMTMPSPKVGSGPAVFLEPAEAPYSREGTSEAPKTDFG